MKKVKSVKKETVTLSKKDFDLLTSMYPKISALKSQLENVVHPRYIKDINEIASSMESVFNPFWKAEEEEGDKNFDALSKISDNHKFKSIWSISEISATNLSNDFPSPVKQINYQDQSIIFDTEKTLSWLDMWKEADKLIRMSGDGHHIFIENFNKDKKNSGHYELSTGS